MPGWKKPEDNKVLGKRHTRLDGPIKVTGKAKYSYDINLPGLLYGRIFRSQIANGTIKSIDISAAEKMPGVKAVILTSKPGDAVRYQGQELGGLCAISSDVAEDAIRAIKVTYEPLPHVVQESVATKPAAPKALGDQPNVQQMEKKANGEVDAGFSKAAAVIEGTYACPVRAHACLETHGVTVKWDDDQHLTCWASTQHVDGVRDDLVNHTKLPKENVIAITEVMGGGFGSKFGMGYEGRMCVDLAKKSGKPVKLLLTREEEHLAVGNAPSAIGRVKLAATADGKICAMDAHVYRSGGVGQENGPMPYIYRVPAFRVVQEAVKLNTGPSRAWRAPNHPQSSWIMEAAMEDLALKLGMDPLEFRLLNDPNPIRQKEWREGAKLIGWERRNEKPGVGKLAGTGRYRRGIGCGAATWGGGGAPGAECRVTIKPDASVTAVMGVQDIGTGSRTIIGLIVAEELGLPREAITVGIGHSDMPPGIFSGGSVTSPSIAPPTKRAAEGAKAALAEAVAAKWGVQPDDVEMADGKVFQKSDVNRSISFQDACAMLPGPGVSALGKFDRALQQGSGVAGCQFAEVEVDTLTGRVQPIKVVSVQDGGVVLNKLTYESQLNGGIIQGIGMALYEDRHMCQLTGRMVNPNLEDYKLPGAMEMPEFVPVAFEYPEATGVSGSAEPAVIPTAAAIRNAVLNATGVAINEAPITPWKVLTALHEAGKAGKGGGHA
jgi:xanthine dehydrogenase YagR molybdenum-binding subunit